MHFDPVQLTNAFLDSVPVRARFHATVNSLGEDLSFWVEGTDDIAVKKVIGCAIIAAMPENALAEALQSIREIWEFYSYRPEPSLQDLSPKISRGRLLPAQKRPDLVIEE